MSVAIAWDLLLILQIELNRGAVSIASKMMVNPWLLNFHVTIAVSTVVGYVALIVLGRKILAGQNQWKKIHGKIGGLTFLLRNATFVTSFMIPIQ
jgi:type IV secretory pathway VirB2 component (pilin)